MEKEFLDALMPHFNMPCQTRDGRRSVLNEYELNHRERKLEKVVKIGGVLNSVEFYRKIIFNYSFRGNLIS